MHKDRRNRNGGWQYLQARYQFYYLFSIWIQLPRWNMVKLILNHQEVVAVKNPNIEPQHHSSKNESIQNNYIYSTRYTVYWLSSMVKKVRHWHATWQNSNRVARKMHSFENLLYIVAVLGVKVVTNKTISAWAAWRLFWDRCHLCVPISWCQGWHDSTLRDTEHPDRKVDVYLMSNFEPKYVINLCPRLKLFWAH
jgi:hypothetical protein